MTGAATDLLLREYQEINAHLRANTTQFVNWFSAFLAFSLAAAAAFLLAGASGPGLRGFILEYGIPVGALLLHVLAFVGIVMFRRYVTAAHCKIDDITKALGGDGGSPLPVRFWRWMTHLMAVGFLVSYFAWLLLLFVR